ncbi:MAG TPA: ankyrin repeat domain-containing protein [Streptosporangiaceae bacterium]|jgi:hypothetical protein
MPLPARPSLEDLRAQAGMLAQLARSGVPSALAAVSEFHPRFRALADQADPRLAGLTRADAQLVIARQYGFPSWPRLRQYLAAVAEHSRSPLQRPPGGAGPDVAPGELAEEFIRLGCLAAGEYDPARFEQASQLLASHPEIARHSACAAATAGQHEQLTALLRDDPGAARRPDGPFGWEPLLYACYSRVTAGPGRSGLEAARVLLAAGADPDAGYLRDALPSPRTALAGALGRGEGAPPAHPDAMELAELLLGAGADPNDSQALYNRGLQSPPDDDGYLRLLLRHGLGTGTGGPWHQRLAPAHPSPRQLLDQELIKAVSKDLPDRAGLLLAHGADPAGRGTGHGAYGGHDSWELATMAGHHVVLAVLAAAAPPPPGDPALEFLGACMAGDAVRVGALRDADPGLPAEAVAREPDLIVRAAAEDRLAAVRLLAGAGLDVNAVRRAGGRCTALHEAAWNGSRPMIDLLAELGADPLVRDLSHHATPADWAWHHGHLDVAAYLMSLADAAASGGDVG